MADADRPKRRLAQVVVVMLVVAACRAAPTPAPIQTYADPETGIAIDVPADWTITSSEHSQLAILQSYPLDKYLGGEDFAPGDTKCDLVTYPAGISLMSLVDGLHDDPELVVTDERDLPLTAGGTARVLDLTGRGADFRLGVTELVEHTVSLACYGTLAPFETLAVSLRAGQ